MRGDLAVGQQEGLAHGILREAGGLKEAERAGGQYHLLRRCQGAGRGGGLLLIGGWLELVDGL